MFIFLMLVGGISLVLGFRNLSLNPDLNYKKEREEKGSFFKENLDLEGKFSILEKRVEELEKVILEDSILIDTDYDKIKEMVYKNDPTLNKLSIDEYISLNEDKGLEGKLYTKDNTNGKKLNQAMKDRLNGRSFSDVINVLDKDSSSKKKDENKDKNKSYKKDKNIKENQKINQYQDDLNFNTQINRELINKIKNDDKNATSKENKDIYREIIDLENSGKSMDEICRILNLNTGEVILLKNLYKDY